MRDRALLLELLLEIQEALRRIDRRFKSITAPADFIRDDHGLDCLDGISMMLISISENIRRLEKIAGADFFEQHPEISWSDVKGIRNILVHDYFNIDAEEIYQICSNDVAPLKKAIADICNAI